MTSIVAFVAVTEVYKHVLGREAKEMYFVGKLLRTLIICRQRMP